LGVIYCSRETLLHIIMKLIKLAKPTLWISSFLAAISGSYAQETLRHQREIPAIKKPADSYSTLLRDAEAMVENGKPGDAYTLLEPLEFEHAGEIRFDYVIGIAALDSGKPEKATLAFERVLAINPGNAAARLDIARAYYQLGDFPRAHTEFLAALKQNPTETARANIQKYLDMIAAQEDGKRTRFSGYLEAGTGHDSNINNSTGQQQVFVDFFGALATLDSANVKTSDSYYAAVAGGQVNHSLNPHWSLYVAAEIRKRGNSSHSQFDFDSKDLRAGISYEVRANRIRVNLINSQYSLGGSHNSDAKGYKSDFRHTFSPSNQLNVFAQSVQYRYVDPLMQPNDIDQQAFGLGWSHVTSDGISTMFGSAHFGTEKDVSPVITGPLIGTINPSGGRNDGARTFNGLRVGGQTALRENIALFAGAGAQAGNYNKENYLFLRKRKDRLYDLNLGVNWRWDKLWTLRPQLSYTKNFSNISIYSYDRMDVSLNVRRDFR